MRVFEPNYQHLVDAAWNREARRLPLYEHGFDASVVERILGQEVRPLLGGDLADKTEAIRRLCRFAADHGYDCLPFERGTVGVIQGGAGVLGHGKSLITSPEDLRNYPWDQKRDEYAALYRDDFEALRRGLPAGMKAVGGVGFGVFETLQDFVPYQELALLQMDEPEVWTALWVKVGELYDSLWQWVLENYSDCFAVCRFGDDLGFRSSTLLDPRDIRTHILPHYRRVIDRVHALGKPFLLHSCGKIYEVMDDLIALGIDAKHSNEDAIDPFDVWVTRYGDRIGNFGGVEMNLLTNGTVAEVKAYVADLLGKVARGHGGIAIGTGNQVSSYTEPALFIAMTEAVREWRGEHP